MRVLDIIDGTTVDGPGFRTSIYFAGCCHHCEGCHNPTSWDMDGGREWTVDELMQRIIDNDMDVTFSGGDPMYQADDILPLAKEIRKLGKTIWCYTGFRYEQLSAHPSMNSLLEYMDVLVDGEFILSRRNTKLQFRGSDNQRIIDLSKSSMDDVVLWKSEF